MCQDAAKAETIFNGAVKDTHEKTEALEKHVKTGDFWQPRRQTSRRTSTAKKKRRGT